MFLGERFTGAKRLLKLSVRSVTPYHRTASLLLYAGSKVLGFEKDATSR
jgi:hypothetical protein